MSLAARDDMHRGSPLAVLFPPRLVPLDDVFRGVAGFGDTYDLAALDALEARLAAAIGARAAKGVVSDALLLGFSLRRTRGLPLAFGASGSRAGTLDEYRIIGLIAAAYWRDGELAAQAAAALAGTHAQPLIASATDIAGRLARAGLALPPPDGKLLGGGGDLPVSVEVVSRLEPTREVGER